MAQQTKTEAVRKVVIENIALSSGYSPEAVAQDLSRRLTSLGMDELDILDAIIGIEVELDIEIPDGTDLLALTIQDVITAAEAAKAVP